MDTKHIFRITLNEFIILISELEYIVNDIKSNFSIEKHQDPRLTEEIVNYSMRLVSNLKQEFILLRERTPADWTLERYNDFIEQRILSFYRAFDNPFLGSQKWYQRINELLHEFAENINKLKTI